MCIHVLAKSNFDGAFLATLLAEEQKRGSVEVGVINDLPSAYSVARTMLAVKRTPVAMVIDANSPEPEVASERKLRAEELLGDAAGGVPFRVLVAVPELAVLFFGRPELLRRVFDTVDDHLIELAQLSPRRALQKLAPREPHEQAVFRILRAMESNDVDALRETELIRDLRGFIDEAAESSMRFAGARV